MRKVLSVLLCSIVLLAGVPPSTFAAAVASISGTVKDTSNSPVSGATITARDANGNVLGQAVSDGQGNYTLSLPIGSSYTLEITPPAMYSQKSPSAAPQGTLGAQGAAVNWVVSFETAAVWFALGGATFIAGSVGAAVGTLSDDKKKTVSATQ